MEPVTRSKRSSRAPTHSPGSAKLSGGSFFQKQTHQAFARLAFSMAGTESNDRSGLLFYILEAASGGLRFRHFGPDTGDSGIRPIAAVKLANAPTLVKRLVGVAERQVRAAWSTDGEQFSWLPAVHSSPTLGC